jgi:hypothetical protein
MRDVSLPGIFRVPIEVIVIDEELGDVIHDVLTPPLIFSMRLTAREQVNKRQEGCTETPARAFLRRKRN